jgi:energy-coupling factor transport system ATP-binding protein
MREPIIEFKNFSFQYRAQKKPTLTGINLKIYPGEKLLIAGPSGSGKSTLGSCINGLIPFNNPGIITGELFICGQKPTGILGLSDKVGTVLQDTDAQFVGLSSDEDIAFSLENQCCGQHEMRERVLETAKRVGADAYLGHSPFRLSGGQKQRVSMAGVLIDRAPVLLLDEPLAALDPLTGKNATALLHDIAAQTHCTVVIIEHRLEDILWKPVDRVVVICDGRIAAEGAPDDIVISRVIGEAGLREPLYVSALKKAGITVTAANKPGRLDTLRLDEEDKNKLNKWADGFETDALSHRYETKQQTENGTPLLEARGVGFTYTETGTSALRGVNFSLYPGEMTAIVGANGAGKSTMAKLMVGFEEEETGGIFYNGENMRGLTIPERAERIGYVMQNPNQMICQPLIFDEVALGLRARNIPEPETAERVREALHICGLTRFIKWPVSALSYGQKKRVTIASALVLNPQILILDEPTAGQDFRHYTDIMDFLAELNKKGLTVLMITHDMHLCLEYAKRALVFSDGRLIADRPAYSVLSDPALARRANLKETSLYELARVCGVGDARKLVRAYIQKRG